MGWGLAPSLTDLTESFTSDRILNVRVRLILIVDTPHMSRFVRILVAALLLVTAALKFFHILVESRSAGPAPRWLILVADNVESIVGAIVLLHGDRAIIRKLVLGLFMSLAAVAAVLGFTGFESCGCLGPLATSPFVMLACDIAVVALVAIWPQRRGQGLATVVLLFLSWPVLANSAEPSEYLSNLRSRDARFSNVELNVRKTYEVRVDPLEELMEQASVDTKFPAQATRESGVVLKPAGDGEAGMRAVPTKSLQYDSKVPVPPGFKSPTSLDPVVHRVVVDWNLICRNEQTAIEQKLVSSPEFMALLPYQRWSDDGNWIRSETKRAGQTAQNSFYVNDTPGSHAVVRHQRSSVEMCCGIGFGSRLRSIETVTYGPNGDTLVGTIEILPSYVADCTLRVEDGLVRQADISIESKDRLATWRIETTGTQVGDGLPSMASTGEWSRVIDTASGDQTVIEQFTIQMLEPPKLADAPRFDVVATISPAPGASIVDRTHGRFPLPKFPESQHGAIRTWLVVLNLLLIVVIIGCLAHKRRKQEPSPPAPRSNDDAKST
jgi:hypothetical protein